MYLTKSLILQINTWRRNVLHRNVSHQGFSRMRVNSKYYLMVYLILVLMANKNNKYKVYIGKTVKQIK